MEESRGFIGTLPVIEVPLRPWNLLGIDALRALFAPADEPRFTVYVVVHSPKAAGGGGSIAGPAFAKIMGFALHHYGIEPTGTQPSQLPITWSR